MLRACWTPSPCIRLSRTRTTTGPPPHPGGIDWRRVFPSTSWQLAGWGAVGMVPTFTLDRSTGSTSSSAPAASPRLRRSSSPWPPGRRLRPTEELSARPVPNARCSPAHIRQIGAGGLLEGLYAAGSSRTPFCLACRTQAIWQCWPVPSFPGLLPTFTLVPGVGLPCASTGSLRRVGGGALSSPHGQERLVAHKVDGPDVVRVLGSMAYGGVRSDATTLPADLGSAQAVGRVRTCRLEPDVLRRAEAWLGDQRIAWENRT
jgi:hypothetical protein